MSAKPCNRCGQLIVFGTEQETGRVIPLMVGARVYRIVKESIVTLDPKALVPHVCATQSSAPPAPPTYEPHFSEPKEGQA